MKSDIRIIWIKLHTYLACFFLPVIVVYIFTGVLYLFDIEGGVKQEFEYPIALQQEFPQNEVDAKNLVLKELANKNHPKLPPDYYPEENLHDWYGYKQEVILVDEGVPGAAKLVVKEHDVWRQLLLIHKGHAGLIFTVFGILLSGSLLLSLGSGLLLAYQFPNMKQASLLSLLGGFAVLIICFLLE